MRYFWTFVLLIATLAQLTMPVGAEEKLTALKPSANKEGLWGLKDAAGQVLIPFKYSYASAMGDGFIQVGLPSKTSQRSPNVYGVLNAQGQTILPIKYDGMEYLDDKKRFKVVITDAKGQDKFGVLDTQGKLIVPVIYEYLERISNMGDEPTNIMKLNDQLGYINIVTGDVLIKPQYDTLNITSLNTDHLGAGISTASKKNKWGVITTLNQVVVPFEYDFIDELSSIEGRAIATKKEQLLQLNFKDNQFINATELEPVYSSQFKTHKAQKFEAKPFDGFYVAQDYPNMKAAFDGWRANKLRSIAIPSFQVNGDEVYVAFNIFNTPAYAMLLPNVMQINRKANGFTILTDFNALSDPRDPKMESENWFSFTPVKDGLKCNECENMGLPVIWKATKPAPVKPFGGIGVAISKLFADSELVSVDDVMKDGPAYQAGLRAKDYIVAIDGKSVEKDTMDQVRDKLRGPDGSQVKVKYLRGGSAHETTIKRAVITR